MKKGYFPKQHGAWAMLILPFLSGMFAAQPIWMHALLFVGWVLVYLFSYPLLQWVRTKKGQIYRNPVLLYALLLTPVAVLLLSLAPVLLKWIPFFIPLFLVNCYFALRNKERAFMNDLAAVIQFCLITFVAYDLGNGDNWLLAAELFGLNVLYFTGTIFFVKTIIREKNNPKYYWLSIGYHLVSLIFSVIFMPKGMWIPFGILFIRAIWSPRTKISIKRCGMLEIVYSALVICTVLVVY